MFIRAGDQLSIDSLNLSAVHSDLYRVFNRSSFECGGRMYGGWWQNIPRQLRHEITINGSPTIELDYPHLHPTLLLREIGEIADGDPYEISGWDRRLVKKGFNTLVNADTAVAALKSIALGLGGAGAFARAKQLIQQIERKHEAIASSFGSGAGLRLQRRDSDMAEFVLLRLLSQSVIALPIHDSFIVAEKNQAALMEAMDVALHEHATNILVHNSFLKDVPQYGDGDVVTRCGGGDDGV